jgi:NAD(P)-dependent dehydrogenase (short-subunit alcohol dehydrogenase family)
MAGPAQAEIPSQLGRSAVVTGATGGLGYETALALAKAGAEVVLTGRNATRGGRRSRRSAAKRSAPGSATSRSTLQTSPRSAIFRSACNRGSRWTS